MKQNTLTLAIVLIWQIASNMQTAFAQQLDIKPLKEAIQIDNSLEELSRGVVPTAYLRKGITTEVGAEQLAPKRIIADVESIPFIENYLSLNQDVKIIQIQVKSFAELNQLSSISTINNLEELMYIYLDCWFPLCTNVEDSACEIEKLSGILSPLEKKEGLTIIYSCNSID